MDLSKLIRKGRLIPIHKTDEQGITWLVGYRRRANSRKDGQEFTLKKPQRVETPDSQPSTPQPSTL